MSDKLIFTDSTWNFDQLVSISKEIETIGREEMGMDPYPCRIEIITFEQMIDVNADSGLPNMYQHWSFGKRFLNNHQAYLSNRQNLAYECIINTNPSLAYCMEDNSSSMQALVIAHACVGHSHVFKQNYLFKDGPDASAIIDYLEFARNYIHKCEESHGVEAVEKILDAAHALMGVSMAAPENRKTGLKEEQKRFIARQQARDESYHEMWTTVPEKPSTAPASMPEIATMHLPEANLLYWLEKQSPILAPWQKEVLRIVRKLSQFYYPSMQCSIVHESAAVYSHMFIMRRLYEKGFITEGAFIESLASTSGVVYQSGFENFRGFNIYTLGWNIAQDIERICTEPTEEDRRWFPDWAGNKEPMKTLRYAWENFRDESFLRQFLSPKVMRDMKLFRLHDDYEEPFFVVDAIHDDEGFKQIRSSLADGYLLENNFPDIRVTSVGPKRELYLTHYGNPGYPLEERSKHQTLELIESLWGTDVYLDEGPQNG